jgi:hypothetical protein
MQCGLPARTATRPRSACPRYQARPALWCGPLTRVLLFLPFSPNSFLRTCSAMWKSEFDIPSSNAILLAYMHPFAQGLCLSRITRVGSINMHARLTCHITSTGPIPTNRRVPSCAPLHPWVGSNTSPITPVTARSTPAHILTRPHMVTSFIRARNKGHPRAFRRWLAHRAGIKGRAPSPTRRERHGNPTCHAPRLTVPFQPYLARCGATEHFLFTNTYVHDYA